jgi:hypothetical protein
MGCICSSDGKRETQNFDEGTSRKMGTYKREKKMEALKCILRG